MCRFNLDINIARCEIPVGSPMGYRGGLARPISEKRVNVAITLYPRTFYVDNE